MCAWQFWLLFGFLLLIGFYSRVGLFLEAFFCGAFSAFVFAVLGRELNAQLSWFLLVSFLAAIGQRRSKPGGRVFSRELEF